MLIVLEGVDGSGKATQSNEVFRLLSAEYKEVQKVSFPDYESPSSALVKMYLNGEFAPDADSVSPYAASSFYAVDRYASCAKGWGRFHAEGGIVVADRYVTSNMIHQAAKIHDTHEKDRFLDWLYDFEYNKLGLPVPDLIVFLDMPPSFAKLLMAHRANKITGAGDKDIHEKDINHIEKAYANALYVADKYNWKRVKCAQSEIRPIEEITKEIMAIIRQEFEKCNLKGSK